MTFKFHKLKIAIFLSFQLMGSVFVLAQKTESISLNQNNLIS